MTITHRWIDIVAPGLGLVWFGQGELRQAVAAKNESERLLELADIAVAASAMVHELQKERGMSAGFLGSAGQRFTAELPAQHPPADTSIDALRDLLSDFDAARFGEEFAARLADGIRALDNIADQRRRVLNLELSVADGIGYYTNANKIFLGLIANIPKLSSIGAVANEGAAYSAFLQSKERAGIERAVLANAFAKDRFDPGMHSRFAELMVIQSVYTDQFRALASAGNRDFYDAAVDDPKIAALKQTRTQHPKKQSMFGEQTTETADLVSDFIGA